MTSPCNASAPSYLPTREWIENLPSFTPEQPMRMLVSGCMTGVRCGFDGNSYEQTPLERLLALRSVRAVGFCPEDYAFGTPRALCDIHGGNGFDVLEGRARVMTEGGEDWTAGMIHAAERMLEAARMHCVELALLLDISAACGSQVIYNGPRRSGGVYQRGPGVCAALLIRNGIRVLSQRDYRTLGTLLHHLDPATPIDPAAVDHHETEWYRTSFGA